MVNLIINDKIDYESISYATVLSCVTKSKSISISEYTNCFDNIREFLSSEAPVILAFGSVAAGLIMDKSISSIEDYRGKVYDTIFPGVTCVVTYALSYITDGGCSGCGKNVIPFLARKDIESVLIPELMRVDNNVK